MVYGNCHYVFVNITVYPPHHPTLAPRLLLVPYAELFADRTCGLNIGTFAFQADRADGTGCVFGCFQPAVRVTSTYLSNLYLPTKTDVAWAGSRQRACWPFTPPTSYHHATALTTHNLSCLPSILSVALLLKLLLPPTMRELGK